MTRAELPYGLKRLPADHRLHLAVRQFLKIVRTLPWDVEAADWYADIRRQLVGAGQPFNKTTVCPLCADHGFGGHRRAACMTRRIVTASGVSR